MVAPCSQARRCQFPISSSICKSQLWVIWAPPGADLGEGDALTGLPLSPTRRGLFHLAGLASLQNLSRGVERGW